MQTRLLRRWAAKTKAETAPAPERLPFVPQLAASDCGLASLAMVLGFYGRAVTIDALRLTAHIDARRGVDLATILRIAEEQGLHAEAYNVELKMVHRMPCPAILHWRKNHFVVLDGITSRGVWRIVDPAVGRLRVAPDEAAEAFGGACAVFVPTDRLQPMRPKTPFGLLKALLRTIDFRHLRTAAATSLLLQLVMLLVAALSGLLVDRVVVLDDRSLLYGLLLGSPLILLAELGLTLFRARAVRRLGLEMDATLVGAYVERLFLLPHTYFAQRSPGDLLARLSSASALQSFLTTSILTTLGDLIVLPSGLLLLAALQPSLLLFTLALAVAHAAVALLPRSVVQEASNRALLAQSASLEAANELFHGAQAVKLAAAERLMVTRWFGRHLESLNALAGRSALTMAQQAASGALHLLGPFWLLGAGVAAALDGRMQLGEALAAATIASSVLGPLSSLFNSIGFLSQATSHLLRLGEAFELPPEDDAPGAARLRLDAPPEVSIERLSFSYGGRRPVLQEVTLTVPAGAVLAVVGPSGCGKSTLLTLLSSLETPTSGVIRVDGRPFSSFSAASRRAAIGVVPQSPHLFEGSVLDNIRMFDGTVDRDRVQQAATLACLHDDIMALPDGYETPVGAEGSALSGGMRQRLAVARAVLHRPRLLLLDEATSALDYSTEAKLLNNLARARCTQIIVAHRLQAIRHASVIVVMEKGRIVESGTHAELVRRDGLYRSLLQAQLTEDRPGEDAPELPTVTLGPARRAR